MLRCHACGADPRSWPTIAALETDNPAIKFQKGLMEALEESWIVIDERPVHSVLFFRGLAVIWSLMDDVATSLPIWDRLDMDPPPTPSDRYGGFERRDVTVRSQLLAASAKLLPETTHPMIDALERLDRGSSVVFKYAMHYSHPPAYWLWSAVRSRLDRTMYVPTEEEIGAAIRYVARFQSTPPTTRQVCALLGMNTNHSARVAARIRAAMGS
jgi:hypothetical protein